MYHFSEHINSEMKTFYCARERPFLLLPNREQHETTLWETLLQAVKPVQQDTARLDIP